MRGIFLDRDGVIIRKAAEGEYITKVSEMEFLAGSVEAIAELSRSGFKVIIVTNQRGVATGKIHVPELDRIHNSLRQKVSIGGGEVCDIFYCPHDVSENCLCRKPKAGMLFWAAEKYELSLPDCWMVGDARSDIIAGQTAGCKTVLITSTTELHQEDEVADICAASLLSASKSILTSVTQRISTQV